MQPENARYGALHGAAATRCVCSINVHLQRFSRVCDQGRTLCDGVLEVGIAGWYCLLRLYSGDPFVLFRVPVEESDEAYLSAEPPKESEDARLPQAHEHGGRTQGHRGPQAQGPQAPGRLIFAPE